MFNFILILLCAAGLAGVLCLTAYFYETRKHAGRLQQLAMEVPVAEREQINESDTVTERQTIESLQTLANQNQDLAGWIYIPDSKIDYPVMFKTGNNDFYLNRDFEQVYSPSGVPFIDGSCSVEPQSENLIVYGHHMKDGSIFADLLKFEKKSYWEQHRQVYLYTLKGKQTYEVIAAFPLDMEKDTSGIYDGIGFQDKKSFEQYQKVIKKLALYDTGVEADYGSQLLTLSTCSYHSRDGRFVVVARKKG